MKTKTFIDLYLCVPSFFIVGSDQNVNVSQVFQVFCVSSRIDSVLFPVTSFFMYSQCFSCCMFPVFHVSMILCFLYVSVSFVLSVPSVSVIQCVSVLCVSVCIFTFPMLAVFQ